MIKVTDKKFHLQLFFSFSGKKIISQSCFDLLLKTINLYKYKHCSEEHQTVIFLDKATGCIFVFETDHPLNTVSGGPTTIDNLIIALST